MGQYKDGTTGECVPCQKGTYNDMVDVASCTPCATGETTSGVGSDTKHACHTGKK